MSIQQDILDTIGSGGIECAALQQAVVERDVFLEMYARFAEGAQ